ncbi:hypothetical protein HCUR_00179 [Holospora curviuscula]|uniref:Uncharacterized protein n=1 Tax=Holospora curviuscula TaxID=1082868 RepID=A0A2S5RED6_9PROT|nr:hypothetical protein HCUR_00179 [Holospora curviuscula]
MFQEALRNDPRLKDVCSDSGTTVLKHTREISGRLTQGGAYFGKKIRRGGDISWLNNFPKCFKEYEFLSLS